MSALRKSEALQLSEIFVNCVELEIQERRVISKPSIIKSLNTVAH
jgi:hypothetical protein